MTLEEFEELKKKANEKGSNNPDDRERLHKILMICRAEIHKMWAATIVGTVLGCDFRDAEHELRRYLEQL